MLKKDAIKHFGSQYAIAKALNIHQSAVSRWRKWVPFKRAVQLNRISGGKLIDDFESYLEHK